MTAFTEYDRIGPVIVDAIGDRGSWVLDHAALNRSELSLALRVTGDDRAFGLTVAAPVENDARPWLYMNAPTVERWAQMLGTWITEEIDTGAASWAKLTRSGDKYLFDIGPDGFVKTLAV